MLLTVAASCARPVGDFGRAKPSFTNDTLMPAVGDLRAMVAGDPVSGFNQTDEEGEMHDRIWRFLVAPHAKDWFFDVGVELKRAGISTASDSRWSYNRYYRWLKETAYQSSRVRYSTIAADAKADIATAPETFRAICRVIEIDHERAVALEELPGMGPTVASDVAARQIENNAEIAWFVRALRYRYDSYAFALDHLLVETPDEAARDTDREIEQLGKLVDRAERGDFCGRDGVGQAENEEAGIASRFEQLTPSDPEDDLPPK